MRFWLKNIEETVMLYNQERHIFLLDDDGNYVTRRPC